ncbi:hypothetical protein FOLKNPGA_02903 [Legionella sp. PC1000]|nr:hypothetical protein FOLKNPGA_02903 [Legionella sp. PC1000]
MMLQPLPMLYAISGLCTSDGKYHLADSNYPKGFIDYNDVSLLMNYIQLKNNILFKFHLFAFTKIIINQMS